MPRRDVVPAVVVAAGWGTRLPLLDLQGLNWALVQMAEVGVEVAPLMNVGLQHAEKMMNNYLRHALRHSDHIELAFLEN